MKTAAVKVITQVRSNLWDRIGIGLSFVCLVHCIALPVVLAGLSMLSIVESLHLWLAFILVPIVAFAAVPGYLRHRRILVPVLFAAGVALLFGALLFEPLVGRTGETLVTITGSLTLIAGHFVNWRLRGACPIR